MSKPTSPSSSSQQQQQQQTIDLTSLSLQNLSSVKQQLDTELEHLSTSFTKLRTAQTKFKECIRSISTGVKPSLEGRQILVPLTSSLYVPGTLKEGGKVIVDVGTGYYVEKKTKDAIKFYEGKVETIGGNLVDLEKIITAKTQNLKVVEDVIRQKVLAGGAPTA